MSDWIALAGAVGTPIATIVAAWINRRRPKGKAADGDSVKVDDAD